MYIVHRTSVYSLLHDRLVYTFVMVYRPIIVIQCTVHTNIQLYMSRYKVHFEVQGCLHCRLLTVCSVYSVHIYGYFDIGYTVHFYTYHTQYIGVERSWR